MYFNKVTLVYCAASQPTPVPFLCIRLWLVPELCGVPDEETRLHILASWASSLT
jgi:hypothetical protein